MSTITASDLTLLRSEYQRLQVFGTFASKEIIWEAQINGVLSRGERTIPFDNGSGVNFNLIQAGMELWVGSTPESKDIGVLRVRSISSGDGGVTGSVTVALNTVPFVDNYYLTFRLFFPLFPRYSRITGTGLSPNFYKDTDISYSDQNEHLKPIVIAGGNRADFIDPTTSTWVVNPHMEDSYSLSPSTTITNFSAQNFSTAGTPTISINSSTGIGTITFTTPGEYWIKYIVTDSNGKSQVSWRYYYAHSTDPTSPYYPFVDFQTKSLNGQWSTGGWKATIKFSDNVTLSEIHDKTIGILWGQSYYGSTQKNITFQPDESTTLISGYLRKETVNQNIDTGIGEISTTIETIESLMKNHYEFSLSLEAKPGSPTEWYEFLSQLTIPRAIHHFWRWHSTLLEIADVFLDTDNTLRAFVEIEDGNLYTMADNLSFKQGIRQHVVSDKGGRIHLVPDLQLLTDSERLSLGVVQEIINSDQSKQLTILQQPFRKTAFVRTSGFGWDGTFSTDCSEPLTSPCPQVEAICASSPTLNPHDEGSGVASFDRQTFIDQTHANRIVGRFDAQLNNQYPEARVSFHGNYPLDIHLSEFWQMSLNPADTERGIVWTNKNLIARNVTVAIMDGYITKNVIFEPEADGYDGVPAVCLGDLSGLPDFPPIPELDFEGTPGTLITGSSVYRKGTVSDNWALLTSEQTSDLIQDPFWRIKQSSSAPSNAIVWRSGIGYIKRSTDGGVTWSSFAPGDPPNDAGDSPAPTFADVDVSIIDASYNTQDLFVFGVKWNNGTDDRAWILKYDGSTWDWKSLESDLTLDITQSSVFAVGGVVNVGSAKMDGDKWLTVGNDDGGPLIRLAEYDGTNIVELDFVNPTITGSFNLPQIVKLDANNALVTYTDSSFFLYGFIVNVNLDTITIGTVTTIAGNGTSEFVTDQSLLEFDEFTSYLVYSVHDGGTPTTLYSNVFMHIATNTISLTVSTIPSSKLVFTTDRLNSLSLCRLTTTTLGLVTFENTVSGDLEGFKIDLNNSLMTTAITTLEPSVTTTSTLGPTRSGDIGTNTIGRLFVDGSGNLTMIAINTAGTLNPGTNAIISSTTLQASMFGTGSSALVVYDDDIVEIVPNLITLVLTLKTPVTLTTLGSNYKTVLLLSATTLVEHGITGGSGSLTSYILQGGVGVGGNLIGLSIGKGTGDYIYVTAHNGSALKLLKYNTSTLTLTDDQTISAATTTEVSNNTLIVRPYGIVDDTDDVIVLYGRFYLPSGDIAHIIYSADGGGTWSVSNDDFGTDYCGAYYNNGLFSVAIRNGSNKLYHGTIFGLSLRATLPYGANPHGLKLWGGTVYIASNTPGYQMVLSSNYGYQWYYDITYNHGTANGVNSIEVL